MLGSIPQALELLEPGKQFLEPNQVSTGTETTVGESHRWTMFFPVPRRLALGTVLSVSGNMNNLSWEKYCSWNSR